MKYIIIICLLAFSLASTAQEKRYVYYFDKDLGPASASAAIFEGEGTRKNNKLELNIYYISTHALVTTQNFTDTTLRISDGPFRSFFADGAVQEQGNYVNGNTDGLWQTADSAGHIIDSSFYTNGQVLKYIHRGYNKHGYPDSVIVKDLGKDELSETYFQDSGRISNDVFFTGQKGLQRFYTNGMVSHADSVFTRDEIEASFPGGQEAWIQYISKQVQKHIEEIDKYNMYGSCIVKFIVNKDGKVTEVQATNMQGTRLAALSEQVIKNSPRWNPAIQYGRKVNAYRLQPVTLVSPGN